MMARPNEGRTANSIVISVRVDKSMADRISQVIENTKTELELKADRERLKKSDLKNWKLKIVYDPKK